MKAADLPLVTVSDLPATTAQPAPPARERVWRRPFTLPRSFRWLTRPRRVLLLLAAVWVVNIFDLGYTLLESLHSEFVELNPLAARLLDAPPELLVLYKTALLAISSTILLLHRRHRTAELACWLLLAAYLYVGICWGLYYEQRLICLEDPAINVDPLIGYRAP